MSLKLLDGKMEEDEDGTDLEGFVKVELLSFQLTLCPSLAFYY